MICVAAKRRDQFSRFGVPKHDRVVIACREEQFSIGGKDCGIDRTLVSVQSSLRGTTGIVNVYLDDVSRSFHISTEYRHGEQCALRPHAA